MFLLSISASVGTAGFFFTAEYLSIREQKCNRSPLKPAYFLSGNKNAMGRTSSGQTGVRIGRIMSI
jgi:hypothetical protein